MLELDKIYNMNCIEGMKQLDSDSIDAVVTDPPYGLTSIQKRYGKAGSAPAKSNRIGGNDGFQGVNKGFMGKEWDGSGIEYNVKMWKEVLCVLKPGGYLLSFGGTRTQHGMVCAVEDAGFDIRDMVIYCFGSGFPKSLDIGKAVDKLQGNERETVGIKQHAKKDFKDNLYAQDPANKNNEKVFGYGKEKLTKGNSEWEGWGTALKPSHEPICMARKPLSEKTVAKNVLKWGTGGINIDGCRISHNEPEKTTNRKQRSAGWNPDNCGFDSTQNTQASASSLGRFPANLIHDGSDEVVGLFPDTKSQGHFNSKVRMEGHTLYEGGFKDFEQKDRKMKDSGSAARFFYCAKASKAERNMGCEGLDERFASSMPGRRNPDDMSKSKTDNDVTNRFVTKKQNNHPTVKPIALMQYLIKLG